MEEYIPKNINRLKRLTNISEEDIGKRIMYCLECSFQGNPSEVMNSFCPDCRNRQHKSRLMYVWISKELIDIIKEFQDK